MQYTQLNKLPSAAPHVNCLAEYISVSTPCLGSISYRYISPMLSLHSNLAPKVLLR